VLYGRGDCCGGGGTMPEGGGPSLQRRKSQLPLSRLVTYGQTRSYWVWVLVVGREGTSKICGRRCAAGGKAWGSRDRVRERASTETDLTYLADGVVGSGDAAGAVLLLLLLLDGTGSRAASWRRYWS